MPTRCLLLGVLAVTVACSSDSAGPDPRPNLEFASLRAGGMTTCAVTADSEAYCWGDPISALPAAGRVGTCANCIPTPTPLDPGTLAAEVIPGAGWFPTSACLLTPARELRCWGRLVGTADIVYNIGDLPQPAGPSGTVTAIAVGPRHICSADEGGQASCWGDYDWNVRGTGGPVEHEFNLVPTPVAGGHSFQLLAAGSAHTCGLTESGAILCWGAPQLVGTTEAEVQVDTCGLPSECVASPVEIQGGRTYTHLATSRGHTCAVASGGGVYCWGANGVGQLGDGSAEDRVEPVLVPLPGPATLVTAGWDHSCALVDSGVYCWGGNTRGQLGLGTAGAPVLEPRQVDLSAPVTTVAAGGEHTCALDDTGQAWCWGANDLGQLGTGDLEDQSIPTRVEGRPGHL